MAVPLEAENSKVTQPRLDLLHGMEEAQILPHMIQGPRNNSQEPRVVCRNTTTVGFLQDQAEQLFLVLT